MFKVDNAIIMAAGTASRFAPISFERPKALISVKGEILIERQIKQLKEAGIDEIIIIVGYKKEQFEYLVEKYQVKLVENNEYLNRNNNSSIYVVRDYLKNSYICSSDNYFTKNPFELEVDDSYYAAVYSNGKTEEWCMEEDKDGYISSVTVGGENQWYMLGHTFWNEEFSRKFIGILEQIYNLPETKNLLWESIFMNYLDVLKMKIKKYDSDFIFEFDSLDELRLFDSSYINHSNSIILNEISVELDCQESDIRKIVTYKDKDNAAAGFTFQLKDSKYLYYYNNRKLERLTDE